MTAARAAHTRRSPGAETRATSKLSSGSTLDAIVSPSTDNDGRTHAERLMHHWLAGALGVAPNDLVIVVAAQTISGRTVRRVYLSLSAAQKAVERAEARGLAARVVLCELRPVGGDS